MIRPSTSIHWVLLIVIESEVPRILDYTLTSPSKILVFFLLCYRRLILFTVSFRCFVRDNLEPDSSLTRVGPPLYFSRKYLLYCQLDPELPTDPKVPLPPRTVLLSCPTRWSVFTLSDPTRLFGRSSTHTAHVAKPSFLYFDLSIRLHQNTKVRLVKLFSVRLKRRKD